MPSVIEFSQIYSNRSYCVMGLVNTYAIGGAREGRTGREATRRGLLSSAVRRMENVTMAATNIHSGARMPDGSPDAAGINAAINKAARQKRAIDRRAWNRACMQLLC